MLAEEFPDLSDMRVVDLGGDIASWRQAPARPRELVIVNVAAGSVRVPDVPWASLVIGDACDAGLLAGERFDLAYSNSVIEHVGGHARRIELANTIHRLAPRHWVQTPNRYFMLEPHSLFPGLQFLPLRLRAEVVRQWPVGHMQRANPGFPQTERGEAIHGWARGTPLKRLPDYHAVRCAASVELLSGADMRFLFPGSRILRERIARLTKSLVAVR